MESSNLFKTFAEQIARSQAQYKMNTQKMVGPNTSTNNDNPWITALIGVLNGVGAAYSKGAMGGGAPVVGGGSVPPLDSYAMGGNTNRMWDYFRQGGY